MIFFRLYQTLVALMVRAVLSFQSTIKCAGWISSPNAARQRGGRIHLNKDLKRQYTRTYLGIATFASLAVSISSRSSEQFITCMAQRSPGWRVSTLGLSTPRKSVITIAPAWSARSDQKKAWRSLDGGLESWGSWDQAVCLELFAQKKETTQVAYMLMPFFIS